MLNQIYIQHVVIGAAMTYQAVTFNTPHKVIRTTKIIRTLPNCRKMRNQLKISAVIIQLIYSFTLRSKDASYIFLMQWQIVFNDSGILKYSRLYVTIFL